MLAAPAPSIESLKIPRNFKVSVGRSTSKGQLTFKERSSYARQTNLPSTGFPPTRISRAWFGRRPTPVSHKGSCRDRQVGALSHDLVLPEKAANPGGPFLSTFPSGSNRSALNVKRNSPARRPGDPGLFSPQPSHNSGEHHKFQGFVDFEDPESAPLGGGGTPSFSHIRNPPRNAFSFFPNRAPGGNFFNFLLFPPPSTT